jgi:hypothetical protein
MKLRERFCCVCATLVTAACSDAQEWDWVQRFQGDKSAATAVGVDAAQNVYVAGTFAGTNYIGTNRLTGADGGNLFIAKLNPAGEPLWTLTATGTLGKMLVASNGSVFVCGQLWFQSPTTAQWFSNVFVARLDDGNVTWAESLPDGATPGAGMAFAPDESLYVIGATNQAFVRRYTQSGDLLDAFAIQREPFIPLAITIGPGHELYIAGRYRWTREPAYVVDFTALVSFYGELVWTWEPGARAYGWGSQIESIAGTPDGGVVSVGFDSDTLPERFAFVVKHAPDGTKLWRVVGSGYFKKFYSAEAVDVDRRGNVYVTGYAAKSYYNRERLWVLTLSPDGEQISDERIRGYSQRDGNAGAAIAVGKDGAVFVAGTLEGWPMFGTNFMAIGPNAASGFVARRSTILPELLQQRAGDDFVISWPATALPFALQKSDDGGTAWFFVTNVPVQRNWRNEVILTPADDSILYRLTRTNEVAVRHVPRVFAVLGPRDQFIDHTNVVVAGPERPTAFSIGAYYDDLDEDPLSSAWTNLQTGEPLTNSISVRTTARIDNWDEHRPTYYDARLAADTSTFPPGHHSVSVAVSDGVFSVTNSTTFEVLSFDTALQKLRSALEELAINRAGRKAVAFFDAALRAEGHGHKKLTEMRWRHFQRQLQRVTSLSEEERRELSSAAAQIQSVLQTR